MTDFLTALWGMAVGLRWLWEFLVFLFIACLATTGGIVVLDFVDRSYARRQLRRGRVRVLDIRTGRERWARIESVVRRG